MLPVVEPGGIVFPVTLSEKNLVLPALAILGGGIRIQGSLPSSRGVHIKMLRFAALHGIKPWIQEFKMNVDGIEDAMEKLRQGRIRYRAVVAVEDE